MRVQLPPRALISFPLNPAKRPSGLIPNTVAEQRGRGLSGP